MYRYILFYMEISLNEFLLFDNCKIFGLDIYVFVLEWKGKFEDRLFENYIFIFCMYVWDK